MSDVTGKPAAPLDEVMLAMDVVDTLRHRQDLATRELAGVTREQQLIDKLRDIYHQQGIEVPDHILKEGVAALQESRFVYDPPKPGLGTTLARLYVGRKRWGKPAGAVLLALLALGVGYFGIWQPYRHGVAEAARIELEEGLPAQLDDLYQTIFEETKVQQAVVDAEALRTRGKTYAAEGDGAAAEKALADLTALRDELRLEYTVRVVNRADSQSGFWVIPDSNTDATNYYIVVEAIDPNGNRQRLPIANEENGEVEVVDTWGLRVPENVYQSVEADRLDDGIIQRSQVGRKRFGYLDIAYSLPVLGGAVTRW
jgi:hypothetical protein